MVSVIIPTYYRNDYLDKCLNSIQNQEYGNIETVVVDDSGVGHASSVVSKYEVEYIEFENNRGPNEARNKGLEHASGDYIQLLDDDDYIKNSKIIKQIKLLEKNTNSEVAYCGFEQENGRKILPKANLEEGILQQCLKFELPACITSTMLISSQLMEMIGPLPDTPGSDDTFWKIEFAKITDFVACNESLVVKGQPEENRMGMKGAIDGKWHILDHYSKLYKKYDPNIQAIAISKAARREGLWTTNEQGWSPRAIYLCFYALLKDPSPSPIMYLTVLATIMGRPGVQAGDTITKKIK